MITLSANVGNILSINIFADRREKQMMKVAIMKVEALHWREALEH